MECSTIQFSLAQLKLYNAHHKCYFMKIFYFWSFCYISLSHFEYQNKLLITRFEFGQSHFILIGNWVSFRSFEQFVLLTNDGVSFKLMCLAHSQGQHDIFKSDNTSNIGKMSHCNNGNIKV